MMEITNTLHSGMCRCCSSEGTFKDIKTKYHWMGEEEVYADMLTDCFDVKLCTPDDMENGICEVCITQLRNAVNFKKQVLHTEEQFKRRLQNKDVKNPIKLESVDEDPIESDHDHLSDADFSGTEYEVPIKEELEEKPKTKKRAAKATTSRAKKAKAEPESSKKHVKLQGSIIKIDPLASANRTAMGREGEETLASTSNGTSQIPSPSHHVKSPASILTRDPKNISEVSTESLKKTEGRKMSAEMAKLVANFQIVISCSNATPLRALHGLNYTCYFCDKQYPDPADLKNHTLKTHQDFRHTSSTRLPTLYNYSVKLDITELTCRFCFQPINRFFEFMDHLRLEHDQRIHTDVKNYMLPFKFDSNPPKCVLCDTEFNTFRNLVEHMNIHFRNFVCEVCGAGFINRASWKTHKANHDYGDFPCTKCPQVFSSMLKLRNHDRYLHMGLGKRNKCAYCGEKFSCLILKNNHMVKEHGVAKTAAKCKACDKTFSNYANLRMHKRRYHLQEKKVKCSECEMMFRDSHALKEHMVKHTGVRDFKCSICDKAYGRKDTLREHLRIHANDRKFKCQYCKMAFVQKCSLKSHLFSKHGKTTEKPSIE